MLRLLIVSTLVVGALLLPVALIRANSAGAESGGAVQDNAPGLIRNQGRRDDTPIIGCAIALHYTERIDLYFQAINDMVDQLGFDSLVVVTPAFQENARSHEVTLTLQPGFSPHRDQLLGVLRHARNRGMTTMLMPIVLLSQPGEGEWRGKIQPEDWDRWWLSYQGVIDYFAEIAEAVDVRILCVGSELLTTETHDDRWRTLIQRVRSRYHGLLTYSTNWDHFHVPRFWSYLDLVGTNGYFDLTTQAKDREQPSFEELRSRWEGIRDQILAHAAAHDRPLLLTEIGYPSLPWGLKDPWNYVNEKLAKSTPNVQAKGYNAFLSAWDDLLTGPPRGEGPGRSRFAGVYFYRWDPYQHGAEDDTGYGFRGKSTINLLRAFMVRRNQRLLRTR